MSDALVVLQVAGATAANQKLSEGWKLLAVVQGANNEGKVHAAYVPGKSATPRKPIGWTKESVDG